MLHKVKNKNDLLETTDLDDLRNSVSQWNALLPERIAQLIENLAQIKLDFPINQKQHALQTATRAYHAGASAEMLVACLCHDIAKNISNLNHAAVGAEILKPFVSDEIYQVLRTHQEFQASHFSVEYGDSLNLRSKYSDASWYPLACKFADEWDSQSFDPDYESLPLEFFMPVLREIFSKQK